jgi:hypothetical protein
MQLDLSEGANWTTDRVRPAETTKTRGFYFRIVQFHTSRLCSILQNLYAIILFFYTTEVHYDVTGSFMENTEVV